MTTTPNDPLDRDPIGSTDDPMSHESGDRWSPSASDPLGGVQQPGYGTSGVGDTSAYGSDVSGTPTYASGSYSTGQDYDSGSDSGSGGSPSDAAKQEAARLKGTAADATRQVAGTAKEQVGQVAGTAKEQAGQLVTQARSQLTNQVTSQRDKATGSLRSLAEEIQSIADCANTSGPATQVVRQGADLTRQAADYLEQHEPSELLDEVRSLAQRRPGAFLLGAAVAGVALGRLTRGAISARSSDDGDSSSGYSSDYGAASYSPSYTGGMAEPVASPSMGSMPPPASSAMPASPMLNEPYGLTEPPAGYDPAGGGRL